MIHSFYRSCFIYSVVFFFSIISRISCLVTTYILLNNSFPQNPYTAEKNNIYNRNLIETLLKTKKKHTHTHSSGVFKTFIFYPFYQWLSFSLATYHMHSFIRKHKFKYLSFRWEWEKWREHIVHPGNLQDTLQDAKSIFVQLVLFLNIWNEIFLGDIDKQQSNENDNNFNLFFREMHLFIELNKHEIRLE